jgi:glycosyltransferase involved in cell wall biosynthesis
MTKRIDLLIETVGILKELGLGARLTVVGGGPLEDALRRKVAAKGLSGMVDITGRVDAEKMPDLYRRHDIYVTATSQEGMSNAMLEAMASGLPIVTTYCEGTLELIADNGIVVRQADPFAFANAVKHLAANKERMAAMAVAARRRAEAFSWPAVASQYVDLYQEVLARRGRAGASLR